MHEAEDADTLRPGRMLLERQKLASSSRASFYFDFPLQFYSRLNVPFLRDAINSTTRCASCFDNIRQSSSAIESRKHRKQDMRRCAKRPSMDGRNVETNTTSLSRVG